MPRLRRLGSFIAPFVSLVGSSSILAWAALGNAQAPASLTPTQKQLETEFKAKVSPLLKQFCASCHSGKSPTAGFGVDRYTSLSAILRDLPTWERASRHLSTRTMPPAGAKQPSPAQRELLLTWIERTASSQCEIVDAGKVTIRRLNREEYNNTVRDLLGVNLRPADDFPSDDVGEGFDNIGDVLTISPLLMEKYLAAAEQLARAAIRVHAPRSWQFDTSKGFDPKGARIGEGGEIVMFTNAVFSGSVRIATPGEYRLKISAYGHQAGPEPCRMRVTLNGQSLGEIDVPQTGEKPGQFEFPVTLAAGPAAVQVAFINDYYQPNDPNPSKRDRNFALRSVELFGPTTSNEPLPESHRKIVFQTPQAGSDREAARAVLGSFASRAYRRPATVGEIDRLMQIYLKVRQQGEPYERGIQVGVMAVLVSPHFLFRVELDDRAPTPGRQQALNGYELASRLSYFLWSSMPDDELTKLAANGTLTQPAILKGQVERMIQDPKARALADNFAAQWLQLRRLETLLPDPGLFPGYSEELKRDMIAETKAYFQAILVGNRSILEFIDSNYTYVTPRLAKHYGLSVPTASGLSRVALPDRRRGGIVTHASVLTVTSNPNRTSPVKRGRWVLEEILGTPPPPPPPDVGVLPDDMKAITAKTIRERLEQHRKDPACANCHRSMDAMGFSLENFDAVGAWRTADGPFPVDARGELADGTKFDGPQALRTLLMSKKDEFVRCLAEKMLVYAIGRGLRPGDRCIVDKLVTDTKADKYTFQSLIKAVVLSDAFRYRGQQEPKK